MLQFHTYLNEEGKKNKKIKINSIFLSLLPSALYGICFVGIVWLSHVIDLLFMKLLYLYIYFCFFSCISWMYVIALPMYVWCSRVYKYYIIHLSISVYIEFNFGFVLWESTSKRCMIIFHVHISYTYYTFEDGFFPYLLEQKNKSVK